MSRRKKEIKKKKQKDIGKEFYGYYHRGRRFEYHVINTLKKKLKDVEIKRNLLSRKPDIIILYKDRVYYFEIKQTMNMGKLMDCYYTDDIVGFFEGKEITWNKERFYIKDKFQTITSNGKGLRIIIPVYCDIKYMENFLKDLKFYSKIIKRSN